MTWISSRPMCNIDLSQNNYNYTVTGLTSGSIYEYRACMMVDGTPYYGEELKITTLPTLPRIPIVKTGTATCVTDTTMRICSNVITDGGTTPINEYGILYSQNSAYSNSNTLINSPSVCKKSFPRAIINREYFVGNTCEITNLDSNTGTYYRAYAINSVGTGYGEVKTEQTVDNRLLMELSMERTNQISLSNSCGLLRIYPALPVGENINFTMRIISEIHDTGNAKTYLYCKPNGTTTYSRIYYDTFNSLTQPVDRLISVNYGDSICWKHIISSGSGSCNKLRISNINSHSISILPSIDTHDNDVVFGIL